MSSSLGGLRALAEALSAVKGGRVDVGIFAGEDQRGEETPAKAAARSKRTAKFIGAGSKEGYFKQGIQFAKNRAKVASFKADHLTNSEIGAKNEFGVGVPKRSFLRSPFFLHGDRLLKDAQNDARTQLKEVGRKPRQTAKKLLDRVGIAGENLVQEAFETRGFGSWAPNAPVTIELKGSDAPLIDTAQLRHAIDSRAVI